MTTNELGSKSFELVRLKFGTERLMDEFSFQTDYENDKTSDPWMVFPESRSDKYHNVNEELKLKGLGCISLHRGVQMFAGTFLLDLLY